MRLSMRVFWVFIALSSVSCKKVSGGNDDREAETESTSHDATDEVTTDDTAEAPVPSDTPGDTDGERATTSGADSEDDPETGDEPQSDTESMPESDSVKETEPRPDSDSEQGTERFLATDEDSGEDSDDGPSGDTESDVGTDDRLCESLSIFGLDGNDSVALEVPTPLVAKCRDEDGYWEVTDEVIWSTSTSKAAVSPEGVLTAIASGFISVGAQYILPDGAVVDTWNEFFADPARLQRIELQPAQDEPLVVGQECMVTARCIYPDDAIRQEDCGSRLIWRTSDESVVSIDFLGDGAIRVSARGPGTATLRVYLEGSVAEYTFNVEAPAAIRLTPETLAVRLNSNRLFYHAVCVLQDGREIPCTDEVELSVADPAVAEAREGGMVTLNGTGETDIAAHLASCTSNLSRLTVTPLACDGEVGFPDPILESLVRQALEKPEGPLLQEAVAGVTELPEVADNSEDGVSALTGIECMTSLESIAFRRGFGMTPTSGRPQIKDVSPLRSLTHLKRVVLSQHDVSDVSVFENSTGLEALDLFGNKVADLEPLSRLTGLSKLVLSNNPIEDITPLGTLQGLEHLEIFWLKSSRYGTPTAEDSCSNNIVDFSALSKLTGLEHLSLCSKTLIDGKDLEALVNLVTLEIGAPNIENLTALAPAQKLETLTLKKGRLKKVPAMDGLTGVKQVDLSMNDIRDVSPLLALTGLETLDLSFNNIESIETFAGLENLRTLDLSNNPLADAPGLAELHGLEHLDLKSGGLTRFPASDELKELTTLDLSHNPLSDLSELSTLTALTTLSLEYCSLEALPWLDGLENLKSIHASFNGLTNISGLSALVGLEKAILDGNPLTELPDLDALDNLTELGLESTRISDMSPLIGLSHLEILDLRSAIVDASTIERLSGLRSLDLSYTARSELPDLSGLSNLETLDVSAIPLADLSVIGSVPHLITLRAVDVEVSDISVIEGMTDLAELYLGANVITDIRPLTALVNLTTLDVSYNEIYSLEALVSNPGLGEGDDVLVYGNNLDCNNPDVMIDIAALKARGVTLTTDCH